MENHILNLKYYLHASQLYANFDERNLSDSVIWKHFFHGKQYQQGNGQL